MKIIASIIMVSLLSGCAGMVATSENLEGAQATLTPRGATYQDLVSLPPPAGKIFVSVYDFRDQTGQYRPAPAHSLFSTPADTGCQPRSSRFDQIRPENLQDLHPRIDDLHCLLGMGRMIFFLTDDSNSIGSLMFLFNSI